MAPNMLEKIIMRKCDVTHKDAKAIVHKARENLGMLSNESVLWSKELETECLRVHQIDKGGSALPDHPAGTNTTGATATSNVELKSKKETHLKAKSTSALNVKPRRCEYV
jgi:hypothetical protein